MCKSVRYTFDDKGNITKKEEGSYTTGDVTVNKTIHYSYSTTHPDRLVSYGGQGIEYDLNGNPTNLGVKALTWTKARSSQESHQYVYNGDKLVGEIYTTITNGTKNLVYVYSGNEIIGFRCNDDNYLFIKNNQHDIIGIVDESGNLVAKYVYDAWGNHIVCNPDGSTNTNTSFIGNINPFRYRGYYYDVETGFYYLNARYYAPEWMRFISPDSIDYLEPSSITGLNLYAYCKSDPVNMYDPSGKVWMSVILGGIFGGIYGGISAALNGQDVFLGIVIGAGFGALTGLATEFKSIIGVFIACFFIGGLSDVVSQIVLDNKDINDVNLVSAFWSGITNAGLSLIGCALSLLGKEAGLDLLSKIILEVIAGSPLEGVGISLNLVISNNCPVYTIGDLKHDMAEWNKEIVKGW